MAEDTLTFPRLEEVLQEYGQFARNKYQDKLVQGGDFGPMIASGDLLNSCEFKVEQNGRIYEVQLVLADYWKYIEDGAKGKDSSYPGAKGKVHWPNPSAILNWIRVKPIIPRPDANGRIPTERSLAYLIGRKHHSEGVKPHPFLEQTAAEATEQFKDKIIAAFSIDLVELGHVLLDAFAGHEPRA